MADPNTLIAISAFSGLAGALISQTLIGLFAYLRDKRKHHMALNTPFSNKKIEIGENFYFMNGERMSIIQKNISF